MAKSKRVVGRTLRGKRKHVNKTYKKKSKRGGNPPDNDECGICLEPLPPDTKVETECHHKFHKQCLSRWCNVQQVKTCPICRRDITGLCRQLPPDLRRTDEDIHQAVQLWCRDRVAAEAQYGHISQWDTSGVTNMSGLFLGCNNFNDDISGWDVSNVIDMSRMFWFALAFNKDIGRWNVSNVTNMSEMFWVAQAFNHDIGRWNVSNVTDMNEMFLGCRIADEFKPKFTRATKSKRTKRTLRGSGGNPPDNDEQCVICLEQLTPDTKVETECHHMFHKQCLLKWCGLKPDKTCPICRGDITEMCEQITPFDSKDIIKYVGLMKPRREDGPRGIENYNAAVKMMNDPRFDVNVKIQYRLEWGPEWGGPEWDEEFSLFYILVDKRDKELLDVLLARKDLKLDVLEVAQFSGTRWVVDLLKKHKKISKSLKSLMS